MALRLIHHYSEKDLSKMNNVGEAPLHAACRNRNNVVCSKLLEKNADPNLKDREGTPPLLLFFQNGMNELIPLLLSNGAKVDAVNANGDSCLHLACAANNTLVCDTLLHCGASTKIMNAAGKMPTHSCMSKGHFAILHRLLDANDVKVNALFPDSNSLLHAACIMGNIATCVKLIKRGAVINILNNRNQTPLYVAVKNNACFPIIELLDLC